MARILVLGSQPTERGGLALVMEFAGHRCAEAGSLQEAAKALREDTFDLVLSDSTIGESNAEQIVKALKAASPGAAVMVLSEEAEPSKSSSTPPKAGASKASSSSSDEVITLPFSPVKNLSPQFSPIRKREAFLVLLPEQESLRLLKELPETPGMLNKLAVLYHSQEKYSAAERLYKRALEVSEKTGDQPREAASILNNLGSLYHDQQKYSNAEPLYKKSLSLAEKEYGQSHPKVARRLTNLVELYRAQGKDKEAAPLLDRLTRIAKPSRA